MSPTYKRWYDHDPLLLEVIDLLRNYQTELKAQAEIFLQKIEEKVSKEKDFEYFLLTNLRLEDGFLRIDFKNRFGVDFVEKCGNRLDQFVKSGALLIDDKRVKLSDQGMLIMDHILLNII